MKRTIRPGYYAGTRMAEYGTFGIQQDAYPLWGIWINDEQLKYITREWLQKEAHEQLPKRHDIRDSRTFPASYQRHFEDTCNGRKR